MSKKEIKESKEGKRGQRRKKKLLIGAEERNTHRDIKMLRKQAVQLRNQLEIAPMVAVSFSSVTQLRFEIILFKPSNPFHPNFLSYPSLIFLHSTLFMLSPLFQKKNVSKDFWTVLFTVISQLLKEHMVDAQK